VTTDPEILDPEPVRPTHAASGAPGVGLDGADLLPIVERAFPGIVLRARGPTVLVDGPHEQLRVVKTPLVTLAVMRGMRIPLPPEPDRAIALLASVARGERVLVEERGAGTLRRTHLVKVEQGRLSAIEDTTNDRDEVSSGVMRVCSFTDGLRDAPPQERAFITRASGGVIGRFKRKLMEKLLDKTIGAVVEAVQEKGAELRAEAQGAITVDDGSRKLGPGR
jgi:hypothetical protein